MDNTGPYLTYDELLIEMSLGGSSLVNKSDIELSNKMSDSGGDLFEYSVPSGSPSPKVGDVVEQQGAGEIIIEVLTGPNRIRVKDTGSENTLVNGPANLLHSEQVPRFRGEQFIQEAMDFIDEQTGQFFNARNVTINIEGNNTPTLWLPVPIIKIDKLIINSTDTQLKEGEDFDFVAFKGRQRPQDDRRNPRIKLNVGRGRDSIFIAPITNRVFIKEALTEIQGAFGFLEPDGRTPSLIKEATKILSFQKINDPVSSSSSQQTGPIKRTKVDLHEQEFFELSSVTDKGSVSGNSRVDQILAKFKAPVKIEGSMQLTSVVADRERSR